MREKVHTLVQLGPFPDEAAAVEQIDGWGDALHRIVPPVTDEEARILTTLFAVGDCYGVAWTLLHLIEPAPNWPLADCLQNEDNEWIQRLRRRAQNKP